MMPKLLANGYARSNVYISPKIFEFLCMTSQDWRVYDVLNFCQALRIMSLNVQMPPHSKAMQVSDMLALLSNYRYTRTVCPLWWRGGPQLAETPRYRLMGGSLSLFMVDAILDQVSMHGHGVLTEIGYGHII